MSTRYTLFVQLHYKRCVLLLSNDIWIYQTFSQNVFNKYQTTKLKCKLCSKILLFWSEYLKYVLVMQKFFLRLSGKIQENSFGTMSECSKWSNAQSDYCDQVEHRGKNQMFPTINCKGQGVTKKHHQLSMMRRLTCGRGQYVTPDFIIIGLHSSRGCVVNTNCVEE